MARLSPAAPVWIRLFRSAEGHRTYLVRFRVEATGGSGGESIYSLLFTAGLPVPGSFLGIGNHFDPWAFATPEVEVAAEPVEEGKVVRFWFLDYKFETPGAAEAKGGGGDKSETGKCTTNVENPLLEPQKISQNAGEHSEEQTHDRHGNVLQNSAFERIRGSQVEFERSRRIVRIEQNVLDYEPALLDELDDTLNRHALWGRPRRSIRLVVTGIQQKWYGQCFRYYTRQFEFRIRTRRDVTSEDLRVIGDWDRRIPDEGSQALNGRWRQTVVAGQPLWELVPIPGYAGSPNPNPFDPNHYIALTDRNGNPIRMPLDGSGRPFEQGTILTTVACSQSSQGAPQGWTVTGFGDAAVDIVHTGLCNWSGGGLSLTYSVGDAAWVLSSGSFTGTWRLPAASWNRRGVNVMPKLLDPASIGTGPVQISLSPSAGSQTQQGRINVEHYDEGDFLRLGIPANI